jgi:hypothetical protein
MIALASLPPQSRSKSGTRPDQSRQDQTKPDYTKFSIFFFLSKIFFTKGSQIVQHGQKFLQIAS